MDWIRRFLQSVHATPSNEELGRRSSVYPDEGQSHRSVRAENEDPSVLLRESRKLKEFRMLVGITTDPSFKASRGFNPKQRPVVTAKGRPAPNLGLYPTVVDNEFKSKNAYKRFSVLINLSLGLQIIVAAALTALGASHGSHTAVTVFGGINTVLAGFLTFLKGSGLPHRLKYYRQQWARVREYIEARERDLGTVHLEVEIDVHQELEIIRAMFEEVRADIEQNTPDRFVGSSNLKSMIGGRNLPSFPPTREIGGTIGGIGGVIGELREARSKMEDLANDIDGSTTSSEVNRAKTRLADDVYNLKSKLQQRMKEVEDVERGLEVEVETKTKNAIVVGEKKIGATVTDRVKELGDMEKDVEGAGIDAHDYIRNTFSGEKQ